MADAVDLVIAYKFVRQLSTKWEDWEAYELGLIDDDGRRIKRPKSTAEKNALPAWKNLVRNLKRILEKLPFGRTRLGSFAAALWLIKEETGISDVSLLEHELRLYLYGKDLLLTEENDEMLNILEAGKYLYNDEILYTKEDLPAIATVFGAPVFEVPEITTKKRRIVGWTDIRKI